MLYRVVPVAKQCCAQDRHSLLGDLIVSEEMVVLGDEWAQCFFQIHLSSRTMDRESVPFLIQESDSLSSQHNLTGLEVLDIGSGNCPPGARTSLALDEVEPPFQRH